MKTEQTHILDSYNYLISAVREDFLASIDGLPEALRQCAIERVFERVTRAQGRHLLGEYAPWIIADLFGIKNSKEVQYVASSWLHMYFFVLIVDDLIDQPDMNVSAKDFIVASVLYQKGLQGLLKTLQSGEKENPTISNIDSAFAETAATGLRDLQSTQQRIQAFSENAEEAVTQKLAILRICARAIRSLAPGNGSRLEDLDYFINRLALGIQILDDVTDVEEDLVDGQVSYVLRHYINGKSSQSSSSESVSSTDQALLSIVESGVLGDALATSIKAFEDAEQTMIRLRASSDIVAREYLCGLINSSLLAKNRIDEIRRYLNQSPNAVPNDIQRIAGSNRVWAAIEIRKSLRIVAQSS